jgi:hypothetical protein
VVPSAIAAAHGDGTFATRHELELLRERLLTEDDRVRRVINALDDLRRQNPTIKKVAQVLAEFRKNKHRMRYAEWKRADHMIGSGVVEAACKTLVVERPKLSRMRWSTKGAHSGGHVARSRRARRCSHRLRRGCAAAPPPSGKAGRVPHPPEALRSGRLRPATDLIFAVSRADARR